MKDAALRLPEGRRNGMKRKLATLVMLPVVLAACADPGPPPADADAETLQTSAFVLETPAAGPQLCVGGVQESLPPQCEGLALAGWDWGAVEGEKHSSGTRWGEFQVTGTYDGSTFTVLEAGPPTKAPDDPRVVWTRCPEPDGGWAVVDGTRISDADMRAAADVAEAQDDFSGVWVDNVPHGGTTILNAAFTGDLARHEAELREVWGGPLCLQVHERTFNELSRIQRELGDGETAAGLGLQSTWSDIDVLENEVQLGVVIADADGTAALVERYGEGAVRLFPALVPASG
jgi:hypothetical protein